MSDLPEGVLDGVDPLGLGVVRDTPDQEGVSAAPRVERGRVVTSRRSVLARALVAASALLAGPGANAALAAAGRRTVYRLDPRAKDGSLCNCRACRAHARNKRFATAAVADRHRAHPGCRCRVVATTVERRRWQTWFVRPNGSTRKQVDLRHLRAARRR